jgi:hypothetical protein
MKAERPWPVALGNRNAAIDEWRYRITACVAGGLGVACFWIPAFAGMTVLGGWMALCGGFSV